MMKRQRCAFVKAVVTMMEERAGQHRSRVRKQGVELRLRLRLHVVRHGRRAVRMAVLLVHGEYDVTVRHRSQVKFARLVQANARNNISARSCIRTTPGVVISPEKYFFFPRCPEP